MANWSTCNIYYEGTEKQLKEVLLEIQGRSINNYLSTDNGQLQIDELYIEDNKLYIHGQGRWSAPLYLLSKLAVETKTEFEGIDAEPGSAFFIVINVDKEGNIDTKEDTYYSQLHIDYWGTEEILAELEYNFETNDNKLDFDLELIQLLIKNGISEKEIKDWLGVNDSDKKL